MSSPSWLFRLFRLARLARGRHGGYRGSRQPWRSVAMARTALCTLLLAGGLTVARADTVYLAPDRFIEEAVGSVPPKAVWLTRELQGDISRVLGHPYPQARLRCWPGNAGVALILDEIGKEFPITAGFVVAGGRIQSARVLIYRETRGQEISQPAFLRQFDGIGLTPELELDRPVDNITGATLSVDAMQRMARTALVVGRRIDAMPAGAAVPTPGVTAGGATDAVTGGATGGTAGVMAGVMAGRGG